MSKVKQTNSEIFEIDLDLTIFENEKQLNDELFKIVAEAYSEQLKVYSDEKVKNIYGLEYSDRELIVRMISHILRKRGLSEAFKKLYNKKEVSSHEGIEFEILNRELRFADVISGRYVWKNPNIYEFYLQTRKIAKYDFTKERGDLVVLIGLKILDKYSSEDIKEKYRASYM